VSRASVSAAIDITTSRTATSSKPAATRFAAMPRSHALARYAPVLVQPDRRFYRPRCDRVVVRVLEAIGG
jgi:hypothetical protein